VPGLTKLPFAANVMHYDDPPPDSIGQPGDGVLEALRAGDRFRFANRLHAWIEIDQDKIVGYGYADDSRGLIGSTRLALGAGHMTVTAAALPDMRDELVVCDGWVTFTQTVGGRTGVPLPRTVRHAPFIQLRAPLVWSTLSLTIRVDGCSDYSVVGASGYPRHWVYDGAGHLALKTGLADFKNWAQHAFGRHTPWGDEQSPALITAVETALERELSTRIMRRGQRPEIKHFRKGAPILRQGEAGHDVYLLLDGMVAVDVDGVPVAELGPGVIFGERAGLEGGRRTSTVRAVTPVRVAAVAADQLDADKLLILAESHHREEERE
jgi:hypothetical protein